MKRSVIYIAAMTLVMGSCAKEENNIVKPTPGDEVRFSGKLSAGTQTKTAYGEETATGIKVNWKNGDKVLVYGTNCLAGREMAEYNVTNADAEGNEVLQNFANSLDKTGEFGVQWGMEGAEKCDFYSVYPSVNNGHNTTITPNTDGAGVTVRAHIRPSQFCVFNANSNATAYSGTPYDEKYTDGTMPDAFMYAVTPDQDNGTEVVNLRYTPFSTVLKFRFEGFTTSVDLTSPYIYLQKVILTAPDGVTVAGNFDVTIGKDGKVTSRPVGDSEASNVIEVNTILPGGSYVRLGKNMPIDFSIFTIPQDGLSLSETWNVVMQTNAGNFRYKLKPSTNNTGKNSNLVAGQVHKLNIPILTVTQDITLNPADWMTQIPRNVYLSELSLPGSWYSVLEEYQGTGVNIANQYAAGVRAFNLDCRLTYESTNRLNTSGTGNLRLVCAGTDGNSTFGHDNGDLVLDKMKEIGALIANNPEEYVVVVLTVAEKPLTRSAIGTYVYGTTAPREVLNAIATMLADSSLASYIYDKPITPNTTVYDVLGKIIVKVNTNTSKFLADGADGYTSIPNAMVSLASMAGGAGYTDYTDITAGVFNSMQTSTIYNSKTESGLTFYYHQAQKTYASGSTPNLNERHAAIDDITAQSRTIYEKNLHNAWFQIGIGGYNANDDTDKLTIASDLNGYLLKKVQNKLLSQEGLAPSPVGIVLMNYCTGDSTNGNGAALVKAILEMNTMFRLNRDPAKPEWPDQESVGGGDSGSGESGGSSGGSDGI
ncbi:MAG: hypothetical protein SOT77_08340 [Candidatus Cryptobacteroides sp.]|nr:hypothetical protein [Bacteroides sp.]MDY2860649.1 hypothetical protein [Candidatus Cryptobacteroides sp.]